MPAFRQIASPCCPGRRRAAPHGGAAMASSLLAVETTVDTRTTDANTDLARTFEPLRVAVALGALLLGVLVSLR